MDNLLVDDSTIIDMMKRFGGSFIQALANAYIRADNVNKAKLKAAFPEYWIKYQEMYLVNYQQK